MSRAQARPTTSRNPCSLASHGVAHLSKWPSNVRSCALAGGLVQGLNEDSIDVQNAISEKLGAFLHHM